MGSRMGKGLAPLLEAGPQNLLGLAGKGRDSESDVFCEILCRRS